jgi:hypothetical protein
MEINRSGQFEFRTFPPSLPVEGLHDVERDWPESAGDQEEVLFAATLRFGSQNNGLRIDAANFWAWKKKFQLGKSGLI